MLTLIYVLYIVTGLTQYPLLERNAYRSIEDFNKKPSILMHWLSYIAFMLINIHLEPAYRFSIYVSKPWIKK